MSETVFRVDVTPLGRYEFACGGIISGSYAAEEILLKVVEALSLSETPMGRAARREALSLKYRDAKAREQEAAAIAYNLADELKELDKLDATL